jgi:hypothetical protein
MNELELDTLTLMTTFVRHLHSPTFKSKWTEPQINAISEPTSEDAKQRVQPGVHPPPLLYNKCGGLTPG